MFILRGAQRGEINIDSGHLVCFWPVVTTLEQVKLIVGKQSKHLANLYVQVWTAVAWALTMDRMNTVEKGAGRQDLIVVGAGILGLATAYRAHKQGMKVLVIERHSRPVGASIMNFGHACFTGQADIIQPVAAQAREGWAAAAQDAGFWAAQPGTLIPAVTELEMQVLREFAEHRGEEQVQLLDAQQVNEALGHERLEVVGGARLPLDMRVNPREAAWKLAEWLEQQGVQFQWLTNVTAVADGTVCTTRGEFSAPQVVVCPGVELMSLFPGLAEDVDLKVCALAMALVRKPTHTANDFCMLTGTSIARYDGLTSMPSAVALKEELVQREPELVDCIANLMVTAIPEGLLIGDSHEYHDSPTPFIDEQMAALLQNRAAAYVGVEKFDVLQRWQGRYANSVHTNLVLRRPDEKTTVAVVASGIGMTLSFGIASLILEGGEVPGF